jgi:alcohol dehydrogenase class IV
MNLEFATSSRVIFGRGEFKRVGDLAESLGKRALILVGKTSQQAAGNLERLQQMLRDKEIPSQILPIDCEPTVELIDALAASARAFRPEVIIAMGGGSVMDAGKAIGALLTNEGSALDYLEEVGAGKTIAHRPIPTIAIPTTAGTGSEVTKNAVLRSASKKKFKRSMRSPMLRPEIALVDPMLTVTAPAAVTAASGLDALTQLIESFVSRRSGILTDGLAREGLTLISSALEQAYFHPEDLDARDSVSMAALLSGMTLDNAGLGAVHGLASPIGAMFEAPHGVVCANLLPEITELNLAALEAEGNAKTLAKYTEIARILTGEPDGRHARLVTTLKLQRRTMHIPRLSSFGITKKDIPEILLGCRGGSMNTNPIYLSDDALAGALEEALKEKLPVEEAKA